MMDLGFGRFSGSSLPKLFIYHRETRETITPKAIRAAIMKAESCSLDELTKEEERCSARMWQILKGSTQQYQLSLSFICDGGILK